MLRNEWCLNKDYSFSLFDQKNNTNSFLKTQTSLRFLFIDNLRAILLASSDVYTKYIDFTKRCPIKADFEIFQRKILEIKRITKITDQHVQ